MSKLGVYWSVMHRRPQDYAFFKQQQPTVFKIMDGGHPDYQWAKDNLPDSLVIARDWALSEQHSDMLKSPTGTGTRHAHEWDSHANRLGFDRAKTLILGINEPRVWEPGVPEALRLYTIALCETATVFGLRVGAMQLSVGWPNNDGPDTLPNWSAWHGVDNAIRHNNGALICHEYWADNGPFENWGWWGGRVLKCPWQVPIVIGECGIDMYVKDGGVQHESRGWRGRKSPEQYASELADYTGRMSADSRFVGCAVFTCDFANGEWASFDVEPAYNAILATPIPIPPPTPQPEPPVTVHLPSVGTGAQPTEDEFNRVMSFVERWEGEYQNHPQDIGNWTGCAVGKGELKGTKYGISACSYPELDIENLTREQARAIYRRDYWQASGAAQLPWPANLLVMDTAVLHGVGTAQKWLKEVGADPYAFAAKRLHVYTKLNGWPDFGRGWVNRTGDLLIEASK